MTIDYDPADMIPRRPSAIFVIGLFAGFFATLALGMVVLIAVAASDAGSEETAAVEPAPATSAAVTPSTIDGAALAAQLGCTGCHSTDGSQLVGPTWRGLAGSERQLATGDTVVADEAYLRRSITDPGAEVLAGFPDGIMPPNYGDTLSPQEIDALVDYIISLGD